MKTIEILLAFAILTLCFSCKRNIIEPGEGQQDIADWTELTHSNNVEPDYSTVFKQNEVLRFDIKISEEDWNIMQDDLNSNVSKVGGPGDFGNYDPVWVPCSVFFNGIEWYKVGIRYKGNSSLHSTYNMGIRKLSFKLDFDQFEDDYPEIKNQRFYGFKQLNLKNNYDDKSNIREKVASDLFLSFGLASPQTAFCVVYVDYGSGPQYYGVYTLVEEVDDSLIDSWFADGSGNLYKPDGAAASFAKDTYNDDEMVKENNEDEADYSDVYGLYTILNNTNRTSDIDQWCADLEQSFNVDMFLKWLAVNTTIQNWDTYGNKTHNYYLYNNPENNLLTWIPWDNNEAFGRGKQEGALNLNLESVDDHWPLIRYVMDVPKYKALYDQYLQEFIGSHFNENTMVAIYSQYYDLLKAYAYDEVTGYSFLRDGSDFDNAIEELKNHVKERVEAVEVYLSTEK